jgi:hypothetical protein
METPEDFLLRVSINRMFQSHNIALTLTIVSQVCWSEMEPLGDSERV